eukprot:2071305-Rhodomonas_salina.2
MLSQYQTSPLLLCSLSTTHLLSSFALSVPHISHPTLPQYRTYPPPTLPQYRASLLLLCSPFTLPQYHTHLLLRYLSTGHRLGTQYLLCALLLLDELRPRVRVRAQVHDQVRGVEPATCSLRVEGRGSRV